MRQCESKGTSNCQTPQEARPFYQACNFLQATQTIGEENSFPHAPSMEISNLYIYHKNQPNVGIQHGYLMDLMGWVVIHHPKCLDLCYLSAWEERQWRWIWHSSSPSWRGAPLKNRLGSSCWKRIFPWKINGWNVEITQFLKENHLLKTPCLDSMVLVIFQGVSKGCFSWTSSLHLKMDGWNIDFLWDGIFSGASC